MSRLNLLLHKLCENIPLFPESCFQVSRKDFRMSSLHQTLQLKDGTVKKGDTKGEIQKVIQSKSIFAVTFLLFGRL